MAEEDKELPESVEKDRGWVPIREKLVVGKLDSDRQNALKKALGSRLDRNDFESRFVAKENLRESLTNRSIQLEHLLTTRSDRKRLQELNVIKEGGAGGLQASAESLKRNQTKDKLNHLMGARPSRSALVKSNILQSIGEMDEEDGAGSGTSSNRGSGFGSKGFPGLVGGPRQEAKGNLEKLFSARPTRDKLVEQKILPELDAGSLAMEATRETDQLVPRKVDMKGVKVVAVLCAWAHTIILDEAGVAYAFGSGQGGRLGLPAEDLVGTNAEPTPIPALKELGPVSRIACGDNHTAAIAQGKLYVWGHGVWGRLGLGHQDETFAPTQVPLPLGAKALDVTCGAYHTIVRTDKGVYGFGWNKNGRLTAPAEIVTQLTPRLLESVGELDLKALSADQNFTIGVTGKGGVVTWGAGTFGCLGHGDQNDQFTPKVVSGLSKEVVVGAASGSSFALAFTKEGKLYSWGQNNSGQLGRDIDKKTIHIPGVVDGVRVGAVAAAKAHALALDPNGQLLSWGKGAHGVLGHNDEKDRGAPAPVEALKGVKVVGISCSWSHSACVTANGELYTWGSPQYGKLGYMS